MRFSTFILFALWLEPGLSAADWRLAEEPERQAVTPDLVYAKRTVMRKTDGNEVTALLTFFNSKAFRLEVVDLGAGPEPTHGSLTNAFRDAGCVAGVNGGFFHPDYRPLGMVIAGGQRTGALETSKLLTGVISCDDRGIYLERRAQFKDRPGITALLQSGPYLIEGGGTVRGLSPTDPRKRTFIATDWRGHWVLGATLSSLTLAELADCLAAGSLTGWKIDRAINLDGGSSTGFYFDRGAGNSPATISPWKRVRNLIGITPR
jgi:hypothetical protein